LKKGDRVKFDHMGEEHSGIVLEVTSSAIGPRFHDIVRVKSDRHTLHLTVNVTLFPGRVRKDESR
jgi:hypothetical protein